MCFRNEWTETFVGEYETRFISDTLDGTVVVNRIIQAILLLSGEVEVKWDQNTICTLKSRLSLRAVEEKEDSKKKWIRDSLRVVPKEKESSAGRNGMSREVVVRVGREGVGGHGDRDRSLPLETRPAHGGAGPGHGGWLHGASSPTNTPGRGTAVHYATAVAVAAAATANADVAAATAKADAAATAQNALAATKGNSSCRAEV